METKKKNLYTIYLTAISIAIIAMMVLLWPQKVMAAENSGGEKSVVGYIFVGDSRLKGIDMYGGLSKNPDIWSLSKVSRNYNYLLKGADRDIQAIESANPQVTKWYEIYCLGVNDMGNVSKYVSWYQSRAAAHNVILAAVPPTKKCKKIPNSSIENFNASLLSTGLPYMDLYTYLSGTGVSTGKDGIHYSAATCKTAADYMAIAARFLGK